MRRWILGVPVFLLIAAVCSIGFGVGWEVFAGPKARATNDRRFEQTPERVARGKYLIHNVAGCFHCHTPRDAADKSKGVVGLEGAGAELMGPGRVVASNITPDRETGIGTWSDDEIARAVREGVGRDGRALFPMMPYMNYRHMSDEDLGSVISYLRTIPAVRHSPGTTEIIVPVRYLIRTVPRPVTEPVAADLSTPVKRGEYLATLGSCADCHTTYDDKRRPIAGLDFAGGNYMEEHTGTSTAPNITPDETGIKGYSAETFVSTLHTGMRAGKPLSPVMPAAVYGGMNDDDLTAIYAYLRTTPAVKHIVDAKAPRTLCRVCNKEHGGGERN
jgi:mono/diheme cytochrome c family protein